MYQNNTNKIFLALDGTDIAYFAVKLRRHVENHDLQAYKNHAKALRESHGSENFSLILKKYRELFDTDPPETADLLKSTPALSEVSIGSDQDYRLAAALIRELRQNELWEEVIELKSVLAKENIFNRNELRKL